MCRNRTRLADIEQYEASGSKQGLACLTETVVLLRMQRWFSKQGEMAKAVDKTAQRALEYSRLFEDSGEQRLRSRRMFDADRMAEAADALLHVAEHQQHLRTGGDQKGPPPAPSIRDHLQRAYFRIEQAGYFLRQAHDSRANSFPEWAREFYQLAVQAYERGDLVAADENTKSAEDVVKALENLAQAAAPAPVPPVAPPPDKKEPI